MQNEAHAKIGHELILKSRYIKLWIKPINNPKAGANWSIFLKLGAIKGILGKIVKKIQAPAKLLKNFVLIIFKAIFK